MLYIASDHAGYKMKKYLVDYIKNELKKEISDLGPDSYNENDDFPDFAIPLSKKVAEKAGSLGILICGTGHGMCMAANKIPKIKAIIGYSITGAEMGRRHNDANIICLAGRVLTNDHATAIIKKFIETDFQNEERYIRRNKKLEELL